MKKTKIVFAVIFTVSVGLAIAAALLGNSIQSLLISVLSVLYLVCFILSVIEDHLSKIVSLKEIETFGSTLDVLQKIKRDLEAQEMVKSKSTETCKAPEPEEEQKEPTTDSTK